MGKKNQQARKNKAPSRIIYLQAETRRQEESMIEIKNRLLSFAKLYSKSSRVVTLDIRRTLS